MPLKNGTLHWATNSSIAVVLRQRMALPSTMLETTRAVSPMVSRLPRCSSPSGPPVRNRACAPSCWAATSKEMRVRVEFPLKIMAIDCP